MQSLSLLLLQVAVILGACRLTTPLFARLLQPPVIAEMMTGLLLGPSLLGWLAPQLSQRLFPAASLPTLSILSQIGLVLFMFLVGWRLDAAHLRAVGRLALATSLVSVIVPFALGSMLATAALPEYAPSNLGLLPFALFVGTAMSITAFPVLVRILQDQRLLATPLGALATACAAFNDAIGWLMLAAITAVVRAGGLADAVVPLVALAAYAVVMMKSIRPLLVRLVGRPGAGGGFPPARLGTLLMVVLVSAWGTEMMGVHALFGAFFAGVIMPRSAHAERAFSEGVEPLTTTLLLPLFFAVSGLNTSIPLIDGWHMWLDTALILAVAVAGKGLGSVFAARAMGATWRDASMIGVLLNTRGLVELVVLNIGLDLGILSPTLFSMMVVMALATTVATSPLLTLIRRDRQV